MMDDIIKDDWGLESLHNAMLEILQAFDKICNYANIQYCLAYGSALGAKRHGGFIPWDDDVDVYMDQKDYSRFKDAFEKSEYAKGFHLQELYKINGIGAMIKIRKDGTTFIEELYKSCDMHQGIYIDLFLIGGGTNNKLVQKFQNICSKYITVKRLADIGYTRRKAYVPFLKFLALFPEKFLCGVVAKPLRKYDSAVTGLYREPDRNSKLSVFPTTWLFPAKRMRFEGVELSVPAEIEKYLEMMYGDYMTIPNIDRIKWKQHAAFWSVNENYDKYVPEAIGFSDEK